MAILHRFCCAAHGQFDAFLDFNAPAGTKAPCPHGCDISLVEKVLGCSISVGASKNKAEFIDRKMNDIARQFGVTDLDVRAGRSSAPSEFRWNEPEDIRRARISGQTYSMPVDPAADVIAQAGTSTEVNLATQMKDQGVFKMNVHVDPRMDDRSALPKDMAA